MATFVASQRNSHISRHTKDGHLCGLTT